MTLVTPVSNYTLPSVPMIEIVETLSNSLNAQVFSYGQNSSQQISQGFIAQSCIVDGRNMQSGDTCDINFSNQFIIKLRPGIYRSYIIPAYTNTSFTIDYQGGNIGTALIRLYNYQMLPCDYSKEFK